MDLEGGRGKQRWCYWDIRACSPDFLTRVEELKTDGRMGGLLIADAALNIATSSAEVIWPHIVGIVGKLNAVGEADESFRHTCESLAQQWLMR